VRDGPLFEPPEIPNLRTISYVLLGALFIVIAGLAVTADSPPRPSPPATPTDRADVAEKRLQLSDGRTVLCLIFPGTIAASCEWGAAR
jgi:hypothetical protein